MDREIYLDNAATTPLLPETISAISSFAKNLYGNPSSTHLKGLEGEEIIESTRKLLALFINATPNQIYFTSCGTESNNWAIWNGILKGKKGKEIITSPIEHKSILNPLKWWEREGYTIHYVKIDKEGRIDIEHLMRLLSSTTIMVCFTLVNSETGVIQEVNTIESLVKGRSNAFILWDGVQAMGKIKMDFNSLLCDALSISAHKINALKGVGALVLRNPNTIKPLLRGGPQERNLRAGTENVIGIWSLKNALEYYTQNFVSINKLLYNLKEQFVVILNKDFPEAHLNSPLKSYFSPHIVNFSIPDCNAEIIVNYLSSKKIFVSEGSACSQREANKHYVLEAIGLDPSFIKGTIRVSFSPLNTLDEIKTFFYYFKDCISIFRK